MSVDLKSILPNEVIFEDNHLIVINKFSSDIVQGDKTGDTPLSEKVKEYLKEKYNKPGNVFCGIPHRLDRPTSGVIVFAKTSKALSRMNRLFQEKKVEKTYWAVVKEHPGKTEDTLVHYLVKNQKQNKSYAYFNEQKNAKKAELSYLVIGSSDNYHYVEVHPSTGRHHQIRAQLATIGSPIKGDLKYGFDRSNKDGSIHLHARSISFIHPVRDERVTFTASPPDDILWKGFLEASNN